MTIYQARKLAEYHTFTKGELYQILKDALEQSPEDYWTKPNNINALFDNGYHFNTCRDWIGYREGINDDDEVLEIFVIRILQTFGKYSKVQLPKKKKRVHTRADVNMSQKPML